MSGGPGRGPSGGGTPPFSSGQPLGSRAVLPGCRVDVWTFGRVEEGGRGTGGLLAECRRRSRQRGRRGRAWAFPLLFWGRRATSSVGFDLTAHGGREKVEQQHIGPRDSVRKRPDRKAPHDLRARVDAADQPDQLPAAGRWRQERTGCGGGKVAARTHGVGRRRGPAGSRDAGGVSGGAWGQRHFKTPNKLNSAARSVLVVVLRALPEDVEHRCGG